MVQAALSFRCLLWQKNTSSPDDYDFLFKVADNVKTDDIFLTHGLINYLPSCLAWLRLAASSLDESPISP